MGGVYCPVTHLPRRCGRPAQIHHLKNGVLARKSSDFESIPLCHDHHLGPRGTGIENGIRTWTAKFGVELDLLRWVRLWLLDRHGEVWIDQDTRITSEDAL